jgi:uroporphyrinogen-III synthase
MTGPLSGFTIGITGHRRWDEQAEMLTRRGAQVVHGPVMHTTLLHDADATLAATQRALDGPVDAVVLTTGIGTRSWFAAAESSGLDAELRIVGNRATVVARGPKARSAAIGAGLDVDWQAPNETSDEMVAHLERLGVRRKRVIVQRDGGDGLVATRLRDLGADVVDVPVYRWHPPDDQAPARRLLEAATAGRVHALTFTCAYAVGNAFHLAPDPEGLADALNSTVHAVAVGPVCADALRRHGVTRVVEPGRARLGAMVQALVSTLVASHRVLVLGDQRTRWQGAALVHADDTVTVLTPGEERVLDRLVRRAPAVVAKASLVDAGVDAHAGEAAVARLRAKLGPLGAGIRAVPRRGYSCALQVEPAPPPTRPHR